MASQPTLPIAESSSRRTRTLCRSRAFISRAASTAADSTNAPIDRAKGWTDIFIRIWKMFFALSCLASLIVDPLFFFLINIEKQNNCIVIDRPITKALVIVRSVTDALYAMIIFLQLPFIILVAPELLMFLSRHLFAAPKTIGDIYSLRMCIFDIFIACPLPQMWIRLMTDNLAGSGANANFSNTLLRVMPLIQYIPKLIRFLPFLSVHVGVIKSDLAHFVTNLLFFILCGHVVGSFWYLFGLQRVNECLWNACNDTDTVCELLMTCDDPRLNDPRSNLLRAAWRGNESAHACFQEDGFPYGIYLKAVNLTTYGFSTRYSYSLFWGYQQISTLAGNQVPSYFVGEIFFVIVIISLGLLSFGLFIGNMQNFLQTYWMRMRKYNEKKRDSDEDEDEGGQDLRQRFSGGGVEAFTRLSSHNASDDVSKEVKMLLPCGLPPEIEED